MLECRVQWNFLRCICDSIQRAGISKILQAVVLSIICNANFSSSLLPSLRIRIWQQLLMYSYLRNIAINSVMNYERFQLYSLVAAWSLKWNFDGLGLCSIIYFEVTSSLLRSVGESFIFKLGFLFVCTYFFGLYNSHVSVYVSKK